MGAQVKWRAQRGAWFLYVYANGTQTSKRFGPTNADRRRALRRAKEINSKIERRALGLEKKERHKRVPFSEFAQRWLEEKVLLPTARGLEGAVAPKTAKMREQMVRLHLTPFLADRDLREIDFATIGELETHFIRTGRPPSRRSIEIALGTLRLILADAMARRVVGANAVDVWKTVQTRGSRRRGSHKRVAAERVLDSEEREHLLETAAREAPAYSAFVLFLAETGCRISEALTLTWADVDIARGEALVHRHKTGGEPDPVELSGRILDTLRGIRPDICPLGLRVFRTPGSAPIRYENFLHRVWKPLVLSAFGRDRRVTPHCLRHTWASLHLARGTPIEWIRQMGGWSSSKMLLDVYGHYLPREMRGFSNALSSFDLTRPNQAQN